jgi:nitric oxide reductase subunit B
MTTGSAVWSMVSIILLIAGIAAMLWYHTAHRDDEDPAPPKADPLFGARATPSMLATRKYFFTVIEANGGSPMTGRPNHGCA